MITDRIANSTLYPFGSVWKQCFDFLSTLNASTSEGKYPIDGDNLFAIVMTYTTAAPEGKLFESHRHYVDVQTVLDGAERFECAPADSLILHTPYDTQKEAAFYLRQTPAPIAVDVDKNSFVVFFPNDAHLAGLTVGATDRLVKKVVVKIRKELLGL